MHSSLLVLLSPSSGDPLGVAGAEEVPGDIRVENSAPLSRRQRICTEWTSLFALVAH